LIALQVLMEVDNSAELASQKLGEARSSMYRWRKYLQESKLRGLEGGSRRPKRLRTVSCSPELTNIVLELSEEGLCVLTRDNLGEWLDLPMRT